jgi:hypothetical protein
MKLLGGRCVKVPVASTSVCEKVHIRQRRGRNIGLMYFASDHVLNLSMTVSSMEKYSQPRNTLPVLQETETKVMGTYIN